MSVSEPIATPEVQPDSELTFCAVHPDRETGLRCNKCGRLMCTECAVRTPVGYRCRECVRGQEDKFFTANPADNVITFSVCAGLTGIAAALLFAVGAPLLFIILLGLPAGAGIAEMALRATQRRRSRYSGQIAAGGAVVGGLIGATAYAFIVINNAIREITAELGPRAQELGLAPSLEQAFGLVLNNATLLIFIGMIAFAVYGRYRMRM